MRVLASLLLFVVATPCVADTNPPPGSNELFGFFFTDVTLTKAPPGPIYYVVGDINVQSGATLTIESGVTLLFRANHDTLNGYDFFSDSEIIVEGALVAVGTVTDSILFTSDAPSPSPGDWGQIKFVGGDGLFEYARFSHGHIGIRCVNGSVSASDVRVEQITDQAFWLESGDLSLTNSAVSTAGIGVQADTGSLTTYDNDFDSLSFQGMYIGNITGGSIDFNRISNCTLDGIYIHNAAPDVRWNTVLDTGGNGIATRSNPPVIIGALLGNTIQNANGHGIFIRSVGAGTLRFCDVHDCGGNGIDLGRSQSVFVENSLVDGCLNGIVTGSGNPNPDYVIRNVTVDGSAGAGILVDLYSLSVGGSVDVSNCILTNNLYGLDKTANWFDDVYARYSNVWPSSFGADTGCNVGCQSFNPLYLNPAADDYHLQANSPLRVLGEGGTQMGRYGPDPGDVTGADVTVLPDWNVRLLSNYPNPFRHATTLSILAREDTNGHLRVFDIRGRLLQEMDLALRQGANEIRMSRGNLSSGIYLYQIQGDGFFETRKMVVR